MKSSPLSGRLGCFFFLLTLTLAFGRGTANAAEKIDEPQSGEFNGVGAALLKLLQSRDTMSFTTNTAVSAEDWLSVVRSNLPTADAERIKGFAKGAHYNRARLESSAKGLVARADTLKVDFSKGDWSFQVLMPKSLSQMHLTNPAETRGDAAVTIPYLDKLQIVLARVGEVEESTTNAFRLMVRGLQKFPNGWRISEGMQWTAFPQGIADAKTLLEMAIQEKVAAREAVTGQDDPALLEFGETLVRFIRERDLNVSEKELFVTSDSVWKMYQKLDHKGPSREELDAEMSKQTKEQIAKVNALLKMMEEAGIDLKNADVQIKEAFLERCQASLPDSLEGLMGSQFKLGLSVNSKGKAANGKSLSGEYLLAARQIMRTAEGWKLVDNLHWEKLPDGVLDAKTVSDLAFESYVAEHGKLPLQTIAPEIEFTPLDGDRKIKLSEFRGKVVILEFWATWCGPCQEPMATLQKIRDTHPDWKDQVAIIPLSIDETMEVVRAHVTQRAWTNTFNVWAGEGGWRAAAAKAFRVKGVPTSYVIDQQGKIIWAGHPAGMSFTRSVDAALKK